MMDPIYLDYNATTPVAPEVIAVIKASLEVNWANPSSSYSIGAQAKQAVENNRRKIARMLNVDSINDIIFTSGGTEANKLAIESIVYHRSVEEGTIHVITSNVEHCSVMNLLEDLQNKGKIELTIVPVNPSTGSVQVDSIVEVIRRNTGLVTIMHANNETGAIMPISEIGNALESVNADRQATGLSRIYFHTDAAQTIGKIIVDAEDLKVDYLTVVGHKFYGPRIGALYARGAGTTSPVIPLFLGGGQEKGFRSGTENTCMIEGLGTAAELVSQNIFIYSQRMAETRNHLAEALKNQVPGLLINFEDTERLPNTLSISVPEGTSGAKVLAGCSDRVFASLGAACHSGAADSDRGSILTNSGLSHNRARRTIRLSVGRGTSLEDVEAAAEAVAISCRS